MNRLLVVVAVTVAAIYLLAHRTVEPVVRNRYRGYLGHE